MAPLTWPVIVQHYLHLERRPQGRSLCSRSHSGESGRRQARGEASRPPALGLRLPRSWCCRSPTRQLPQRREAQDAGALRAARRAYPRRGEGVAPALLWLTCEGVGPAPGRPVGGGPLPMEERKERSRRKIEGVSLARPHLPTPKTGIPREDSKPRAPAARAPAQG